MNTRLTDDDVRFDPQSGLDTTGRVFHWKNRVFRGIWADQVTETTRLLDSGLIEELVATAAFPATWPAELEHPRFGQVLEHERLTPVTFPHEWSYEMLLDAGLRILEIEEIARRHGYSLADCHPYNVIFHKGEPKFVDLGAFRPVPPGTRGWKAYESFVQTYLYPLMVWRPGDQYTARLILSYGTGWPHESYLLYQYSSLRWLGSIVRRLGQLRGYAYKGRTLDAYPNDFVLENSPAPLLPLVKRAMALNSKGLLPFQGVHLGRLRRRLESMRSRSYRSEWGGYQDGLFDETGAALPSPRFDGIREELVRLGIDSIVELAGNQGTFCRSLLAEGIVSEATCTDGDDGAIDRLHRENKDRSHAITPAVLDFMNPMGPLHLARPTERFAADAVLALAVIHHLLLKPPFYPIDEVLRVIGEYGHRYVVTEFMPKGLHDGRGAPPLPRWYTLEWFRESFERHFETVTMRPLDEYRTLFIGKKRTG